MLDKGEFYKDVLDNLYDGVYFVDRQRCITYWNKGAERISGYAAQEVIGRPCSDNILSHVNDQGCVLCHSLCPLAQSMQDGQVREAEVYLRHSSGHRVPVLVRVAPMVDASGHIIGAVESFSDNSLLTAARQRASQLAETAERDPLTGLGNRRFLERKMEACLVEARETGSPFAALFVDVDHFKNVNDSYGHDVGDEALKMVAETLRHSVRVTDFVGRWGGEEFLILLLSVDPRQVGNIANKLRALIERSALSTEAGVLRVTVSIGVALSVAEDTPDSLVRRADHLLYQSKASGRNCVTAPA